MRVLIAMQRITPKQMSTNEQQILLKKQRGSMRLLGIKLTKSEQDQILRESYEPGCVISELGVS